MRLASLTTALAMPVGAVEIVEGDCDSTAGPGMVVSSFDGFVMVVTLSEELRQVE